jgi:hypothetical protein
MINPKKLSIMIAIGVIIIGAGMGFLYWYIHTPIPEPVSSHHFQVMVNDTFGIGEKHS